VLIDSVVLRPCAAQDRVMYTDPGTNITFGTWSVGGSVNPAAGQPQATFTFGMALPQDALTKDATEYIGYLVEALFHRV
jgi:cellobiose dehydrogenase (acceptor)